MIQSRTVAELSKRLEALISERPASSRQPSDSPAPPAWSDAPPEKLSRLLPRLLRGMIIFERLIIGLWGSLTLAAVSVFASSIPYIYDTSDKDMRCGAFALTDLSLFEITFGLKGIVFLVVGFQICRMLIRCANFKDYRGMALVPMAFWLLVFYSGYASFYLHLFFLNSKFLETFPSLTSIGQSRDAETCKGLIKHPPPGRLLPASMLRWNETHILHHPPS